MGLKTKSKVNSATREEQARSRRDFLRASVGVAVGGALAAGCGAPTGNRDPYALPKEAVPGSNQSGIVDYKTTACGQCEAGCGIKARVVEGRLVHISGNPLSPVNGTGIGPRGQAAPQVLYDPDRIKGPMKRKGGREGGWEQISWDEALKILAGRLSKVRDDDPRKLAMVVGRRRGVMLDLFRRFAKSYGTPWLFDTTTVGDSIVADACYLMQGVRENPAFDLHSANYVLSIGSAILESSCQGVFFARTRENERVGRPRQRARIVHVGASESRTGTYSHELIAIKPGTEAAFALSLCHVLVRDGEYDKAFVESHCAGFNGWTDAEGAEHPGFEEVLKEYTPEAVSRTCDVAVEEIERIAVELKRYAPALAVTDGEGVLGGNGLAVAMATLALNALLGAFDRKGGQLTQRAAPLADWDEPELDEIAEKVAAENRPGSMGDARFPYSGLVLDSLPEMLLKSEPQTIDSLLLYYSNPVYSRTSPAAWREALKKTPFICTFSPFMDETTTEFADLVLPDDTFLERDEDAAPAPGVGFPAFGLRTPVVDRLHDTKATGDVVIELAKAIGGEGEFAAAFNWTSFERALRDRYYGIQKAKRGTIVEKSKKNFRNRLKDEGYWSDPEYRYGEYSEVLQTPSGKFEFYSTRLMEAVRGAAKRAGKAPEELLRGWGYHTGLDGVCLPRHREAATVGDESKFPLLLLPYKPHTYAEGSGANLPWLAELAAAGGRTAWGTEALLHPKTAKEHGVHDGDHVAVSNEGGSIKARVRVSEGAARGTIRIPKGGGHTAFGRYAKGVGGNVMELLAGIGPDPLTGFTPERAVRVKIERAEA